MKSTMLFSIIIGIFVIYIAAIVIYYMYKKMPLSVTSLNPVKLPFFKKDIVITKTDSASPTKVEVSDPNKVEKKPEDEAGSSKTLNVTSYYTPDDGYMDPKDLSTIQWKKNLRFSEPLTVTDSYENDGTGSSNNGNSSSRIGNKKFQNLESDGGDDEDEGMSSPNYKLKLDLDQKFKNIKNNKEYQVNDGNIRLKFNEPRNIFTLRLYGNMKNMKIIAYGTDGVELMHIERFGNSKWVCVNLNNQYDNLMSAREKNIITMTFRESGIVRLNKKQFDEKILSEIQYLVVSSDGKLKLQIDMAKNSKLNNNEAGGMGDDEQLLDRINGDSDAIMTNGDDSQNEN